MNLGTEVGNDVTERRSGLEVDRVPTKLDKGAAVFVGVCADYVRRPISVWVG